MGGAPQRLVGRTRALRKNREALRSELRNCQQRSQALRLRLEEGRTGRKRDRLEGKRLEKETARKKLPITLTESQMTVAKRTERDKTMRAKKYK